MKHAAKSRRKEEKDETTYLRLVKAYFYKAFETVDPRVVEYVISDAEEPLPCDVFLLEGAGSAAQKALYHDPAPRSLGPLVHVMVNVHQQVMNAIELKNPQFINWLLTIPPVKSVSLGQFAEPRGIVRGKLVEQVLAHKSTINVDRAVQAMNLFVKVLAEAMLNCVIMYKHLPGDKDYPLRLCQIASMPPQILQFVKEIPPPPSRKKTASDTAPAPPSAPVEVPVEDPVDDNGPDDQGVQDEDGNGDEDEDAPQ
jgi:hypothetical protein